MSGIFYDPRERKLHAVRNGAEPGWTLVTHDLEANSHHFRRIMRERLPAEVIVDVDWNIRRERLSA
jgi:hypothetical protein